MSQEQSAQTLLWKGRDSWEMSNFQSKNIAIWQKFPKHITDVVQTEEGGACDV